MTFAERVWICLGMVALAVMSFVLFIASEAHINDQVQTMKPAVTTTTTTVDRVGPLEAEFATLKQQLEDLQANRGLTAQEVRLLVETLIPAPNNPPTDDTTSTTVRQRPRPTITVPVPIDPPPTTEKRRGRG